MTDRAARSAESLATTPVACGDPDDGSWTGEELRRVAELFSALGHEGRLQILLRLSGTSGLSVSDLLLQVGGEQSALSHQLRLLKTARLVKSERLGRHVIYTLYDRHVSHVIADTLAHVREES